jgi:hypothetical protein
MSHSATAEQVKDAKEYGDKEWPDWAHFVSIAPCANTGPNQTQKPTLS